VFATRRKGSLFTSGPDRWLVLAGAGLLVLGLVLRLLTDIGRSTAAGDAATPMADIETAGSPAPADPALPATTAETLAATPPAPEPMAVVKPTRPVAPPAAAKAAPKPATPAASGLSGWGVQLGAFGKRANAERLSSRVQVLGYRANVIDAGTLTRVRVSDLADRSAAEAAADSIARALGTRGVVVAPGR
jgi:cell division septation protein DedD